MAVLGIPETFGANITQLCAVLTVEYKWTHQCISYLVSTLSGASDLIVILEFLD
jgi:hypothetical protein